MKAVILAGGKGTRMGKLGEEKPKALLEYKGKPILEHQLDLLKGCGVIVVVNYLKEMFRPYADRVTLVEQTPETYSETQALMSAKAAIGKDRDFLVLNGDVITDIWAMSRIKGWIPSILVSPYTIELGVVEDWYGRLEFIQKPTLWVNAGIYHFDVRLWKEICCATSILEAMKKLKPIIIKASYWKHFTSEEDLRC